jgi:hypothetical protein
VKWDIESQYNAADVQWHSNVCVWHIASISNVRSYVGSWG